DRIGLALPGRIGGFFHFRPPRGHSPCAAGSIVAGVVSLVVVEADESDMRLDRWFRTHYPDLAFSHLQKLLRSGQVRVDGARARSSTRLAAGQTVRVPPLAGAEAGPTGSPGQATDASRTGTGEAARARGAGR